MMFDMLCVYLIHYKGKWQTRRRYNPNRRPAIPGKTHKIKIDRTPDVYGYIEIMSVYSQKFGDINQFDAQAEGFSSIEEYKKYFLKVNGPTEDNDLIWTVSFRKLDYKDVECKAISEKMAEMLHLL